jgi:hypothetical protein
MWSSVVGTSSERVCFVRLIALHVALDHIRVNLGTDIVIAPDTNID